MLKPLNYGTLLGVLITVSATQVEAADTVISVGFKGAAAVSSAGGNVTASYPTVECQIGLGRLVSITAGLGSLSYTYTGNSYGYSPYTEEGRGTGASVDVKFYPGMEMFNGFYVGPGLGVIPVEVDYTDTFNAYGYNTVTRGSYSGTGVEVHAKLGWMFQAGPIRIDPNLQVGYFLAMPSNQERSATMSVFVLAGINVGIQF